ncbi:MAG TPA: cellulase family glycosylhydrolase, partial [Chloroflexota bacterium]|nr:cellulase family glycosylhydrolase [Chloroflexota bacterium]
SKSGAAASPGTATASQGKTSTATPASDRANASNPSKAAASAKAVLPAGKANFLSTRGSKIVDSSGSEVTITGLNWFGMETGTFAPHGLWSRNWEEMLDQVKELGFNTIRLPYSNQLFDPASKVGEGVDFGLNPDLKGLTPLQVMDKIVVGAGQRGLKVLLDQHRPDSNAQSKLWYTDKYDEKRWISDWVALAQRYKGNDTVIGADLHNEPAGDATWGTGDARTDWRMAAEKAGNAILEANPDWLIVVEGIEKASGTANDWYWMGGNLSDAGKNPVRLKVPNKVVYSAHDYGPGVYNQSWFIDKSFPSNMPSIWDAHWAYLDKQNVAPVLIGEFGGRSVGVDTEGTWQRNLFQFMKGRGISYTYWCLNPNSGDTGGVLKDDWKSVDQDKQKMLSSYQAPMMRVGNPSRVDESAVPGPQGAANAAANAPKNDSPKSGSSPSTSGGATASPSTAAGGIRVLYKSDRGELQTNNPSMHLKVVNSGSSPVKLGQLEVRYWFDPDDQSGRAQVVDVDWASVGNKGVSSKVVQVNSQLAYMAVTFTEGDKSMEGGANVEVALRIHKDDWSQYNQENDYSYVPGGEQKENSKITAYVAGKLVWGVEPRQ